MKIPETYEEFLKTPDEELEKISWMEKTLKEAQRFISFINRAEAEFKEKDLLLSEEKKKNAKSQWERYSE